jgi:hypothetical protein
MTTQKVTLTGNTYPHRDALKKSGWKWNQTEKAWEKEAQSAAIIAALNKEPGARQALAVAIGGAKKGCRIDCPRPGLPSVNLWLDKECKASAERPAPVHSTAPIRAQDAHDRVWGEGRYGNLDDPDYL